MTCDIRDGHARKRHGWTYYISCYSAEHRYHKPEAPMLRTRYFFSPQFRRFYLRLNPSPTFSLAAASHHQTIKGLIENRVGPAAILQPWCHLQGSYRQQTAIYSINDIDIVVLCNPWITSARVEWSRNSIFDTIAAPLLRDKRYQSKVRYTEASMCIKVDLGIKVEVLPVVRNRTALKSEPFLLYRPEAGEWQEGYARQHQSLLSNKNRPDRTNGNFIPMIKVLKHLRALWGQSAVSFHLECLLYAVPDAYYVGAPAQYIPAVLRYLGSRRPDEWYGEVLATPCGDRDIFTLGEWSTENWRAFHNAIVGWSRTALAAWDANSPAVAFSYWQSLLGEQYFPRTVTL
jgi:hypothetical protein